jgi:dsRNA-specific ribonuclease
MGLDKYFLMGNGDIKNETGKNEKVLCDLFEAIVGAAAVDAGRKNDEKFMAAFDKMMDCENVFLKLKTDQSPYEEYNPTNRLTQWCQENKKR